jgi:hypothetical protein
MASDSPDTGHQTREQEIERLAQELGRLIQSAEPEKREDLKELAYTLIREEIFDQDVKGARERTTASGPFNPLATGILIVVLGAGFFFIFPVVGLALAFFGFIFIVTGAVITWFKR